MATAKKLPSGSYRVRLHIGGGKYKSFTAPTKKQAEMMAIEFDIEERRETFGKALEDYLSRKSNVLSPSTIRGYRIMQRKALQPLLDISCSMLTDIELQRHFNNSSLKYSPKSIKNQIGLVSAVLGRTVNVSVKQDASTGVKVPTKKDIEKIIDVLKDHKDIECQVLLALTCSLRQSEIAGLKVCDVEKNVIHIRGSKVPDENNVLVYKKENKTSSSRRDVIMSDYLSKEIRKHLSKKKPEDFVFDMTPSACLSRFKKILEENNIYPYTMHSMRHAFVAMLHASGVPDIYVQKMGGWSTDHVMKRVYNYAIDEELKKQKESIEKIFNI